MNRCCGRCDGINDICVADKICETHSIQGCEICYGPRCIEKHITSQARNVGNYGPDDKTKIIIQLYQALKELVELKDDLKLEKGITKEYLERKPSAWSTAKRLVVQYKNNMWGVKA